MQRARGSLVADARATIENFKNTDPTVQEFFDSAYGYAVFPNVGEGGLIAGAARGDGVVFRQGQTGQQGQEPEVVGYTTLTEAKVGALAGGQSFGEIVFFEDEGTFQRFLERGKRGNWTPTAGFSGVALNAGSAGKSDYSEGVAAFIRPKGGLYGELSVGSQKFSFQPAAGGVPAQVR